MNNFSETHKQERQKSAEEDPLERIKELEQQNLELKKRLVNAITDPVTGLERRAGLFQDINMEIFEIFEEEKMENIEKLQGQQLIEALTELIENNRISKMPLIVVMCDVAYLSLANKSGLQGGDDLLNGIGDSARSTGSPEVKLKEDQTEKEKKPLVKFFRHGGDEITAIVREWPDEAEKKLYRFAQTIAEIKGIKDLEDNNLLPHIDYGIAHITEALITLKNIIESKQGQTEIPPGLRLKTLENIWLEIAEMKAKINKTKDRIILLAKIKLEQPDLYDKVIAYLRKGAQNITDESLSKLISQAKNKITGPKWEEMVANFVIQELKYENALNPKNRVILESIL